MKKLIPILLLLFTLPASAVSTKKVQAWFGPEWTFAKGDTDGEMEEHADDLSEFLLRRRNPNKFVEADEKSRYELKSSRGWYLTFGVDPGVIEVQTSPMDIKTFEKHRHQIQKNVFDLIQQRVKAAPAQFTGGGHINIGLSEFLDNPLLLRNFIVDFYNHNELSMGIFNYDTNNALSFWMVDSESRRDAIRVLNSFTRKIMNRSANKDWYMEDLEEPLQNIDQILSGGIDPFTSIWGNFYRGKNTDIHFGHALPDDGAADDVDADSDEVEPQSVEAHETSRIEVRAFRPQASADVYYRQIRLLQKRLDYLSRKRTPIVLKPMIPIEKIDIEKHQFNPPVDPQKALKAFYKYVTESGEDWKDHRDYIWPLWQMPGNALDQFEASEWFRAQEKQKCARELSA